MTAFRDAMESRKIRTYLRVRPINNAHPGYVFPSNTQATVPVPHSANEAVGSSSMMKVQPHILRTGRSVWTITGTDPCTSSTSTEFSTLRPLRWRCFRLQAKARCRGEPLTLPGPPLTLLCHSALSGINSTVFTYGMTGSGKTFTMLGATDAYEKRGLVPRSLSFLFEEMQKVTHSRPATVDSSLLCQQDEVNQYTVSVTYVQIYNESAYDLFSDPGMYSDEDAECVLPLLALSPGQILTLAVLLLAKCSSERPLMGRWS